MLLLLQLSVLGGAGADLLSIHSPGLIAASVCMTFRRDGPSVSPAEQV